MGTVAAQRAEEIGLTGPVGRIDAAALAASPARGLPVYFQDFDARKFRLVIQLAVKIRYRPIPQDDFPIRLESLDPFDLNQAGIVLDRELDDARGILMIFSIPKVLLLLGQPQNGGKGFRPAVAAPAAELQATLTSAFPFSDLPPEPLDHRGLVAVQPAAAVIQCATERVGKTEAGPYAYRRIAPDFGPRETVGDPDKPALFAVTRKLANTKPVLARDDPVQNGLSGLLEPERVEKERDTRRILIPVLKGLLTKKIDILDSYPQSLISINIMGARSSSKQ